MLSVIRGALSAAAPKFKSALDNAGGTAALHGAIGGGIGGITSIFDGEDDLLSDVLKGAGIGAGFGLAGRGAGRLAGRGGMLGSAGKIGRVGLPLAGMSTAFGTAAGGMFDEDDPAVPPSVGAVVAQAATPTPTLGRSTHAWDESGLPPWMRDSGTYFGGLGDPMALTETRSLGEWMRDPELQRIANAQIIQANAAGMREIEGIKNARDTELEQTEALSREYQAHANRIQADDVLATKAIMDHAAEKQEALDRQTDEAISGVGAHLQGGEYGRDQFEAEAASQEARANEARIADQKLLERLGIGSQTILQDLAAAEAVDAKNQAVNIRTSANDKVTAKRTEIADRWKYEKPNILGALASGAMDREIKQRTLGLQGYQQKMQAAQAMREAQQSYFGTQQASDLKMLELGMSAQGDSFDQSKLLKPSGIKIPNEQTGAADDVPYIAQLSPEQAATLPPELQSIWQFWAPIMDAQAKAMAEG